MFSSDQQALKNQQPNKKGKSLRATTMSFMLGNLYGKENQVKAKPGGRIRMMSLTAFRTRSST